MGEPVVATAGRRGSSRRREASSISSRRASLIPLNRVLRRFMQARAFFFSYSHSASQPPRSIQAMAGWLGAEGSSKGRAHAAGLSDEWLSRTVSKRSASHKAFAFKTDLSRRKKL